MWTDLSWHEGQLKEFFALEINITIAVTGENAIG